MRLGAFGGDEKHRAPGGEQSILDRNRDQVERLAESQVGRIVYISCNPSSWARDAALLVAAGYRLVELRPVGQFRWSTHVELASLFIR